MRLYLIGWTFIQYNRCPYKKEKQKCKQRNMRKSLYDDRDREAEIAVMLLQAKGCQGLAGTIGS